MHRLLPGAFAARRGRWPVIALRWCALLYIAVKAFAAMAPLPALVLTLLAAALLLRD